MHGIAGAETLSGVETLKFNRIVVDPDHLARCALQVHMMGKREARITELRANISQKQTQVGKARYSAKSLDDCT